MLLNTILTIVWTQQRPLNSVKDALSRSWELCRKLLEDFMARLLFIVKSFIFYWGLVGIAEQTNVQHKGLSNSAHKKRPSDSLPVGTDLPSACTQKKSI